MLINGAKFQEHCFNISSDIFYSVFYHFFGCKSYDVITYLIHIMQNDNISETKKDILKRKMPFFCISKGPSEDNIFHVIYTLIVNFDSILSKR